MLEMVVIKFPEKIDTLLGANLINKG
uniref:Uncharacterized protein n=1 Tax=Rhizophora mucronata TaxID=61149 RepID=A0A2P2N2A8_RHIMU